MYLELLTSTEYIDENMTLYYSIQYTVHHPFQHCIRWGGISGPRLEDSGQTYIHIMDMEFQHWVVLYDIHTLCFYTIIEYGG